jgi:hypothetical protein
LGTPICVLRCVVRYISKDSLSNLFLLLWACNKVCGIERTAVQIQQSLRQSGISWCGAQFLARLICRWARYRTRVEAPVARVGHACKIWAFLVLPIFQFARNSFEWTNAYHAPCNGSQAKAQSVRRRFQNSAKPPLDYRVSGSSFQLIEPSDLSRALPRRLGLGPNLWQRICGGRARRMSASIKQRR